MASMFEADIAILRFVRSHGPTSFPFGRGGMVASNTRTEEKSGGAVTAAARNL